MNALDVACALLLVVASLFTSIGAQAQSMTVPGTLAEPLSDTVQNNAQSPPNILWLSVEDMSPRLGAYGDSVSRTPNIDRLAAEGRVYTHAFTTAGVCAPSRSSIITGMYQTSIGTHHMRTSHVAENLPTPYRSVPPPYVKTFTEYLRASGYYTVNGAYGDGGNAKKDYQFAASSDRMQPITAFDDAGSGAHWRNRPDSTQPFFAVFNNGRTHEAQIWPERQDSDTPITDPSAVSVPPYYPDTPIVRRDIARHYDNIAEMDGWVGELLAQLEEDGLAENTVVFFWSDHGDGLPRMKEWLYDSGIRVPLIIRWPHQISPGSVTDRLVSFVDLAPTVLSLAGVDIPRHMQGKPFLGTGSVDSREYVYAARDRMDEVYDMVRAVRDKRFKYIRNYYPNLPYVLWRPYMNKMPTKQEMLRMKVSGDLQGAQKLWWRDTRPPEELYDVAADPHEIRNLADDSSYKAVLDRMRNALDRWRQDTGDMGDIPETEMVERMWPGHVQPETAAPFFIPNAEANPEIDPVPDGGTFEGPISVRIYCATQGASIAYSTDLDADPHWLLYTGPVHLKEGTTRLRAKAIRYGYQESAEASAAFHVERRTE